MISKEMLAAARGERKAELVFKNGQVFDSYNGVFRTQDLAVHDGTVVGVGTYEGELEVDATDRWLIPGFIDAHVHLESSMLTPGPFSRLLVAKGTTAVVADPHELANVYGMSAIDYLLEADRHTTLDIYVMLSSCVPATDMETSGAVLTARDLKTRMGEDQVLGLGEMMNYPGVINGDDEVYRKLELAKKFRKRIDGHIETSDRYSFNAYALGGIEANHECTTKEMGELNLAGGLKLMIREGTATKNLEALLPAVNEYNRNQCMFCTDDRHPDHIMHEGHIDAIVRRAIAWGLAPEAAILMATLNPAQFFGMTGHGSLTPGKKADVLVLRDLETVDIEAVYKEGIKVAQDGEFLFTDPVEIPLPEGISVGLNMKPVSREDLALPQRETHPVMVIVPNDIVTKRRDLSEAEIQEADLHKIVVVERHHGTGNVGVGLVEGFDFHGGAIASTIAHDSHNLILAGDNDDDLLAAIEAVERIDGGLVVVSGGKVLAEVSLPVGGLLSKENYETFEPKLKALRKALQDLGDSGRFDAFMTLGFLALPVVPSLKMTDRGMFDVEAFRHID